MMVRREPYECLSTSERRALARNLGGNAEINPSLSEGRIFYFQQTAFIFHFILEVSLWNM